MARMAVKRWPVSHNDLIEVLTKLSKHEKFGGGVGKFNGYSRTDMDAIADYVSESISWEELITQLTGGTGSHFRRPENGYSDDISVEEEPIRSRR